MAAYLYNANLIQNEQNGKPSKSIFSPQKSKKIGKLFEK
jgi:hypothetical protein